ncbi:hypothetical protein JXR93_04125, partial [bacterium]|nr:hypothetical protein [bacterium]
SVTFSTTIYSQHLPLNEREEIAINSIFSEKNSKPLLEGILFIMTQEDIFNFIVDKVVEAYINKEWDDFLKTQTLKLLNNFKIKAKLKKIAQTLFKDSRFQIEFLKIVKNEKEPQKVVNLINDFISEKIKKQSKSKEIIEYIIKSTIYCPENSRVFFKKFSFEMLNFLKNRKESPTITQKIKDIWTRKLVSLPYEHLILDWTSKYVEKIPNRLKLYFKKENRAIFKQDYIYEFIKNIIYNSFKQDTILKKLELHLYSMLTNKESIISNLLYDIIVSDNWFESWSSLKKESSCLILSEDDFIFSESDLSLFFKNFFKNEKEIDELLSSFVENL